MIATVVAILMYAIFSFIVLLIVALVMLLLDFILNVNYGRKIIRAILFDNEEDKQ